MVLKIQGTIEKVNGNELTYTDFSHKYLARNLPVVLTGLTDDWQASKDWVSDDGKPNLCFLSAQFGSSTVQVADCGTKEFTDQKRMEMSVSEFIERWRDGCGTGSGGELLYLKDWHFVKEYPEYIAYNTPKFFSDDWLNLYLDKYRMHDEDNGTVREKLEICCSDYRFVYMGAKGTWTPFHADVFRSYSWSANVCGRKKWYFLSPSQSHLVFDRHMKSSVYDIFEDVCQTKFPGFEKAIWLECTQEEGEIIFVPSGWYHQVHNLEDTISINHNWFNAYNISWVWDLLLREYHEARWYIEDIKDICDDFEGLCQQNLAANAGMNFGDIFIFLIRFALANLFLLHQVTVEEDDFNKLVKFNLKSIRCITWKMESVAAWKNLGFSIKLSEITEDQLFMQFTVSLARTYGAMFDYGPMNFSQHTQFNHLDFSITRICNPEDFVTFLDETFRLVGIEL